MLVIYIKENVRSLTNWRTPWQIIEVFSPLSLVLTFWFGGMNARTYQLLLALTMVPSKPVHPLSLVSTSWGCGSI